MTILEELWNNIHINRQKLYQNEEYIALLHHVVELQKALTNELSEEGRKTLEEICSSSNEMHAFEESDAFVQGFRLGVRILLDAIGTYEGEYGAQI